MGPVKKKKKILVFEWNENVWGSWQKTALKSAEGIVIAIVRDSGVRDTERIYEGSYREYWKDDFEIMKVWNNGHSRERMSTVLVRVQLFVFIHLFVYLLSLHNYFFLEKQLFEGLSLILLYIWEFFHKRIISASKKNMAKMRFRKTDLY